MCGASKHAKHQTEAKQGEVYRVDKNTYNQGAFVPLGSKAEDCVACVRNDTQMITFAKVPAKVRRDYGIGEVSIGRFIEVDVEGDHERSRDLVDFGNDHGQVDLVFLRGAHAYIGVATPGSEGYNRLMEAAGYKRVAPSPRASRHSETVSA
jgi:hypothetical protein